MTPGLDGAIVVFFVLMGLNGLAALAAIVWIAAMRKQRLRNTHQPGDASWRFRWLVLAGVVAAASAVSLIVLSNISDRTPGEVAGACVLPGVAMLSVALVLRMTCIRPK